MISLEIDNPKNPDESLIIEPIDNLTVWICDGTGEGGEFSIQGLYDAIKQFYRDNF